MKTPLPALPFTDGTKLIGLTVYLNTLGDCTNHGTSAKVNTLYIPHPQGYIKAKDVESTLVFIPEQRGPNYWALVSPVSEARARVKGWIGPMDGGNLASTCDSRGQGIIYHVHDRYETYETYQDLTRD